MKKQATTNQEAIERFNWEHLQEIKAVCELVDWSLLHAVNKRMNKTNFVGMTDEALWEISDDITRNAIGILESFSGDRFTNSDYEILEEIVFNRAYDYLTKNGVTIYDVDDVEDC